MSSATSARRGGISIQTTGALGLSNCPVFPNATSRRAWAFGDPAVVTGAEDERPQVLRRVRGERAVRI